MVEKTGSWKIKEDIVNKGFYMATLAVLAASISKKAISKQKRIGSLSIEDLISLSSAEKRRGRWGTQDPLSNIRDISIDITTDKSHFSPYQVENAIRTIQRFTGLNKVTVVIRKNFPIRILDGLITNAPDVANWYIPIRHLKELSVIVYTEQDMRDDFFSENPRSLSKIELTLNSSRVPTSLFSLQRLKELKFVFYERKENSNLVFPQMYNLKSLEKLEINAGSEWRRIYTKNKHRLPDYISKSKNLRELTLSKVVPSPEIKRLRNLEKVKISDILIEPHILEIKTTSLDIRGNLSGTITPKVNSKVEFLDIYINSDEDIVDLSFLSKMKKAKEIEVYIAWFDEGEEKKIIMPKNIKSLSNLEKLVIHSSFYGPTKPELTLPKDFSSLSQLKYLSLRNVKFDFPSSLILPSLEKINLQTCIISNINLSGCSSLKEINIEGPWRMDLGLITIKNDSFYGLSNLRKLKIKNIYATQIPNISGLTNLTSVILDGIFVNTDIPILEKDIVSLTKLKRLTIQLSRLNNTDPLISLPKFITMLPNLEYLNLKSSEISDLSGIDKLKKIKGIKSSIPTLKRIRKRPDNYTMVEMTKNGLSQSDAIKIMKYSSSAPVSQIRRF